MEYPEKNLSEQGREPTTNSTHIIYNGINARIWTQATLVGGECPHHYAILAPPPPPPACWLISLRKMDIIKNAVQMFLQLVGIFILWGITHRDITFLRVKMIGHIFMLLVSLKCLQGCLHCVQHCTTDKTSSRFFLPWAIYRQVTTNMNLKKHDRNSGHPTQAIFQRVAMK